MKYPYNRNNTSIAQNPDDIITEKTGLLDLTIFSYLTWKRDKPYLPSFVLRIRFTFRLDTGKKLYRAMVENIWKFSNRLEIFYKNVRLDGSDFINARSEIICRLKRALGYHTLSNKKITRARFNVVAALPKVCLVGFDTHHIVEDNPAMRKLAEANNITLSQEWLGATDDRFCNLVSLTPEAHKKYHNDKGDYQFDGYRNTRNDISLSHEFSKVRGGTNKISSVNECYSNSANHYVSAISDSDNLKELWRLFCEYGFNDLEQRTYSCLRQ
jgi:hypothetical protein